MSNSKSSLHRIVRKAVSLGIGEKNGEWRVLLGNRILSRHTSEAEADAALRDEREAGKGGGSKTPFQLGRIDWASIDAPGGAA